MHEFKESGVVKTADYDEASHILTLHFHKGTSYTYTGVPPETFRDLTQADSAGQFFQKSIRSYFQGAKVEE